METDKIKPMYGYQLANLYNVSYTTFCKWIEPHATKIERMHRSRYYSINQIRIIFEVLGDPR